MTQPLHDNAPLVADDEYADHLGRNLGKYIERCAGMLSDEETDFALARVAGLAGLTDVPAATDVAQ